MNKYKFPHLSYYTNKQNFTTLTVYTILHKNNLNIVLENLKSILQQ